MKVIDLFAGCGGMSLGFQKANFSIVAAFEYWKAAFDTYTRNFDHPVYQTDLSNIEVALRQISSIEADMIIGGPPCQDFSQAGKRVEGARANLTKAFATIVTSKLPRFFVMENVDRARLSDSYKEARETFKEAGYGLSEIVLDASLCGVPQKRKRFFCIGVLNGSDGELLPFLTDRQSTESLTLRQYYGDQLGFEFYYRHPRNYSRRAIFSIDEPAPTMRGVNRPVPKGYPGHPNDPIKLDSTIRSLTTEERALVQTFPKDFVFIGTKTDKEQMIGNAVPVNLAKFVAEAVVLFDNECFEKKKNGFVGWLVSEKGFSERGAKDVGSRLKRVQNEGFFSDSKNANIEFSTLSPSIKSQLKRAFDLWNEYQTLLGKIG